MTNVLLIEPFPPVMVDPIRRAMPAGVDFAVVPSTTDEDLAHLAADADVLLAFRRPINAQVLAVAPKVRLIQALGAGYDHVDVAAAAAAGVPVAYNRGFNASTVAEHTILLMLVLLKRFPLTEQATRAGRFDILGHRSLSVGELGGATIGLIGLGDIGRAVAERLRPFGSRVLYTARRRRDTATEARLGVAYAPLPELLPACNIVSLHAPLTAETHHLIGNRELAMMPQSAILINTARGELIDEAALRQAIESGALGGAGLDVLEDELSGRNPFADLPQIIVTPHCAGFSQTGDRRRIQMTVANIARLVAGQSPQNLVPGSAKSSS